MLFEAHTADLPRSLGEQLRFLVRIEPRNAAPYARMPAQMGADRDVLESTVIPGSSFTCWNVRPIPRCTICRDVSPSIRSPRNVIVPPVGCSTPVTRLKVVDLPAPFGPIRPTICPLSRRS